MPVCRNYIMDEFYGQEAVIGTYGRMGLVEKVRKVLLHPSEFFDDVRFEGIGDAFKYLAVLGLVDVLLGTLLYMLLPSISPLGNTLQSYIGAGSFTATTGVAVGAGLYVAILVIPFVGAGVLHLFVRLFGGHGSYADTYKVVVYGNTPAYLFGWLPFVGALAALYSLYLWIKGVSRLHGMSMLRSFAAIIVVPFIIGLVISVALAGAAYMYVSSAFTAVPGGAKVLQVDAASSYCKSTSGDGKIWIYLRDIGTASIPLDTIYVSGTDANGALVTSGPCSNPGAQLQPGGASQACVIDVTGLPNMAYSINVTGPSNSVKTTVLCD